ncbi:hypothetical protein LTR62_005676 [Meristemomyces frigidus]|uniref:Non-homologous end-joining factor 1 n=1 Tax=Meristemomyces frigidus TaxID=1508187 RepID=A0AAN7TF48_9PEZI|nr:hypothetical protein LTR62_005676 [Meristemomyces frigidus]
MATWKTLNLHNKDLPRLLVKARLDTIGYTVYLTDLHWIWSEILTKREVERRAIKEDCSIDPGEDGLQYAILLEKLQQALAQDDGTSLSLRRQNNDNNISVDVSAPLPHPLPALKWSFFLKLQPPASFTQQLLQPLLFQAQTLQMQFRHLIHELGEKDRIISKLTDRLETSGNDLTTVFPGVSNVKLSRKKTQREQLARHVRSLGDFDETAWQVQMKSLCGEGDVKMGEHAVEVVLKGLPDSAVEQDNLSDEREGWWRLLDSTGQLGDYASPTVDNARSSGVPKLDKTITSIESHHDAAGDDEDLGRHDDDEFQKQGTPPHLKRTNVPAQTIRKGDRLISPPITTPALVDVDDESTEDESDLDAMPTQKATVKPTSRSRPSRHRDLPLKQSPYATEKPEAADRKSASTSPEPESSSGRYADRSLRKLEAIGGKAKDATSGTLKLTSKPAPSPVKPQLRLGNIGGKSNTPASRREGSASKTSPSPQNPPSSTATPARKHGLGTIGGRKPTTTTTHSSVNPSAPFRLSPATPAVEPATKTAQLERMSRTTGRSPVEEAAPSPRETSQERADRKRSELKRQLEEKAKAPLKKKRKF